MRQHRLENRGYMKGSAFVSRSCSTRTLIHMLWSRDSHGSLSKLESLFIYGSREAGCHDIEALKTNLNFLAVLGVYKACASSGGFPDSQATQAGLNYNGITLMVCIDIEVRHEAPQFDISHVRKAKGSRRAADQELVKGPNPAPRLLKPMPKA